MFCEKGFLRNFAEFTGKHLCQKLFFKACNVIKKESLVQVFSCEFCEISKNTFFYRTPAVAASEIYKASLIPIGCRANSTVEISFLFLHNCIILKKRLFMKMFAYFTFNFKIGKL